MAGTALVPGDPSRVGRYRLIARLGAGGMGVVYLGVASDRRHVAVKVLRPELADDPEFRARFRREVATLVRVKGLCTVRVMEADTESPRPFLVTEYAAGPTLAEYISWHGPLGAGLLSGLATGLAEALAAIHAAGIVHRDLKPSNVILTPDGPKVIDFGIAQVIDATAVTRTGVMVGTVGFMAPEQVAGRAGQAADIFAWAVTIGYAASGRQPFGTGADYAVLYRVLNDPPDLAAVPGALRPLVEAALAKNPEDRPTAQQLLDALTRTYTQPGRDNAATTQTALSQTWRPLVPIDDQETDRRHVPLRAWLTLAAAAAACAGMMLILSGPAAPPHPAGPKPPHAAAATHPPLPVVTVGTYTGRRPTQIDFSADGGNMVASIHWVSWTAMGATGYGTSHIESCVPSCASGSVTRIPAEITLSFPVDGRFTVMTETRQGSTTALDYPGLWALGAS